MQKTGNNIDIMMEYAKIRLNWYNDPDHSQIRYFNESLQCLKSIVLLMEDYKSKNIDCLDSA